MLADMVTMMIMVSWFSVTQDPVEACYVRVLQGLRSNSLVPIRYKATVRTSFKILFQRRFQYTEKKMLQTCLKIINFKSNLQKSVGKKIPYNRT